MMKLREALDQAPGHRKSRGRRHSLGAILSLAVCAMLCGGRSSYAIAQWGRDQGVATGQPLGFSRGQIPCVAAFHRVFKDPDAAAFEAVLREWLINGGVEPGEVLSLDGKTLRGIHGEEMPGVHLAPAYAVRCGAVLAQAATPGKGQELEAAKEVPELVPLQGRAVAGDALLTQREACARIAAGGGDYLLPVKGNQPALYRDLAEAFSPNGRRGGQRSRGVPVASAGMAGAGRYPDGVGGRLAPAASRTVGAAGTVDLVRPGVKRLFGPRRDGVGSLAAPETGVPGGAAAGSERQV